MLRSDSGSSTSVWMHTGTMPAFPQLLDDITCDVCIVGAGIAGLSVAYELSVAGKQVVVLDDGPLAGGETCRTTAHLVSAIDDRYYEMERLHGEDGARLAYDSHQGAIERISEIVKIEGIDCDFHRLDGYLFLGTDDQPENLDKEFAAARRAGFHDAEMVELVPNGAGAPFGRAIRFPRQGQFHVLKYLQGLVNVIQQWGGRLFSHTHVATFDGGHPATVTTATGRVIRAEHLIVATNSPVNDRVEIHTKQMPYRTFVVAARIPKGVVAPALYWDTGSPYHYVRLQKSEEPGWEYLIVGGEDHKTGQANDAPARFARLEDWVRQHWPQVNGFDMRWSGQVMETDDGLAFIGRNPLDSDNIYVATGDSGMGMTHGTIAGMVISGLVLRGQHPWAKLYDPGRIRLRAAGEYLRENLNTAAQYKEYFTGGDVPDVQQIARGEGAIVREGLGKVALYHDENGLIHRCSAVCPHLGGIVQWNSLEKTWDCPAHGSRFAATDGQVVNGPANTGLEVFKARSEDEAA